MTIITKITPAVRKNYIAACKRIADTADNIITICKDNKITYCSLYRLAKQDAELHDILKDALTTRAIAYFERAREIVEGVEEFWLADHIDANCELRKIRKERTNAVNAARLRVDWYAMACGQLCPEIFSDKSKEIKEIQKQIEQLQGAMMNRQAVNNKLSIIEDQNHG